MAASPLTYLAVLKFYVIAFSKLLGEVSCWMNELWTTFRLLTSFSKFDVRFESYLKGKYFHPNTYLMDHIT